MRLGQQPPKQVLKQIFVRTFFRVSNSARIRSAAASDSTMGALRSLGAALATAAASAASETWTIPSVERRGLAKCLLASALQLALQLCDQVFVWNAYVLRQAVLCQ